MPRSPEQYEAMRAATRERVRSAAVRLFARQSFATVNMRQIAEEAGISTGSIYRHFATKEELFGGLVAEAARGLGRTVDLFRGSGDPAESLRAFTEEFLADLTGTGDFVEYFLLMHQAFTQGTASGEDAPTAVRDLIARNAELLEATVRLIERGQAEGSMRPGPAEELASCYFAMFDGLVTMRFALGEGCTVPSTATVMGLLLKEGEDA
ncbi:TetR/AcrR family transcriptional regulator [Nocardiopsis metallicus]|uniref:AcrR family transcriptional regulator n=1 Tax=Nocardiopsis metallicus TaxID=179819 RepID=A0A840WF83_9ACTN|nr:TetR/AcrR family transcriptional regulator [Nocardiopsis metallicus]MBB5490006.1 AcrR family transcriptional regulator [Nocardiopsis metallicus]